ncbi:MAG: hypothetical protein JWM47_1167 [Acidimicrobiales bacterium]|nr:hypothetical protein [Acidimicrobiales bacterium]
MPQGARGGRFRDTHRWDWAVRERAATVDWVTSEPVSDDEQARAASGPVADAEVRDALPEDLDISEFVGPYVFPNNNRRRVPGYLYLLIGLACVAGWALVARDGDAVLVNDGFLAAGLALLAIGAYHLVAGWNLDVDERDALVAATERVGFPVGHASAQLGWRGLRSKPTWRILLYSAENPPTRRGLVLVDGVDGEIVSWFTEDNPEDWSDLDGALAGNPAVAGPDAVG